MSGRTTPTPAAAPATPDVLAGVMMKPEEITALKARVKAAEEALRAQKKADREAKAAVAAKPTARDFVRRIDLAILSYVPNLLAGADVPDELKSEVAQLIANQLHHLSSPERGWPTDLPKPARSEWR